MTTATPETTTHTDSATEPTWWLKLFNDEHNIFSDVVATLCAYLSISEAKAQTLAQSAHENGSTTISEGSKAECQALEAKLKAATTLTTEVVNGSTA